MWPAWLLRQQMTRSSGGSGICALAPLGISGRWPGQPNRFMSTRTRGLVVRTIMLQLVQPAAAGWDLRREHGQSRSDEAGRAAPVPSERINIGRWSIRPSRRAQCGGLAQRPQKQVRGPSYRRGPYVSRKSFARQLECLSHKAVMWEAGAYYERIRDST